jgi:hypothetical protein
LRPRHVKVIAIVLIDSFHMWSKDRVEPLCDNFETLFSEQATHVGLCTFRRIPIAVEDNWYLEDVHFGEYVRLEDEVVRMYCSYSHTLNAFRSTEIFNLTFRAIDLHV